MENRKVLSWLEKIAQPFPENITGHDPRHGEDFQAVKQQIEKLSGIDYILIQQRCKKILLEQAKDLRVAGYLVLAATNNEGIVGLIESLQAYNLLVGNFWQLAHPQRIDAKIAAVKWLNNPRLSAVITIKEITDKNQLTQLIVALRNLQDNLKPHLNEEISILSVLTTWLTAQQKTIDKKNITQQDEEIIAQKSTSQPLSPSTEKMNSSLQITTAIQQIIRYYQDQNELIAAAAYARVLRWGDLKLPPHENFRTRIPSPRIIGMNQLNNLIEAGNAKEAYLYGEELFLEPGFHFLLDLQYLQYTAAKNMGDEELIVFLENQMKSLINRLPSLMDLQFSDQRPFADVTTKAWLSAMQNSNVSAKTTASTSKNNIDNIVFEAKKKNNKNNLPQLLNYIINKPVESTRDDFQKKRALAKICVEYKRYDLALPILTELTKFIENHQLADWEPDLVMTVWNEYLTTLTWQYKKTNDTEKIALAEKIAQIKQHMCWLDVAKAAIAF